MRVLMWLGAAGFVAIAAGGASGQAVVTLEHIAPGNMWHTDISESGSIAFLSTTQGGHTRLFRYTDGIGVEMLDIGDRTYVARPAINSSGQIVFESRAEGSTAAVRYTDGIGVEVLSPPDSDYAMAYAINDHGQVTGTITPQWGEPSPFRYTDGIGVELIDLGPNQYTSARGNAINQSGTVAGSAEPRYNRHQVAFRYSDAGGVEFLGSLGGTMWVRGINDHGDVTGMGQLPDNGGLHFYLYTDEDGLVDLGGVGNGHFGEVFDINNDRWIVGYNPYDHEPILWTPETGWLELDSLLLSSLDADLVTAIGINNAGQIVGNGTIDGVYGVYRLTIHSIPAVPTVVVLGVAGVAGARRRRG